MGAYINTHAESFPDRIRSGRVTPEELSHLVSKAFDGFGSWFWTKQDKGSKDILIRGAKIFPLPHLVNPGWFRDGNPLELDVYEKYLEAAEKYAHLMQFGIVGRDVKVAVIRDLEEPTYRQS